MSRIGEKRPAEESNGETAAKSSLLFGGNLKFSFRPSLLGEAASSLSTYSQKFDLSSATTSPSDSHDRFKADISSKPSLLLQPSLSLTGPRIMTSASPTSASTSSGSLSREAVSPMKKRAKDEQDSRENLFLRCLSESKMAPSPSSDSTPDHTPASPGGTAVFGSNLSERVKPLPTVNKTPSASLSDHETTSPPAPVSEKAARPEDDQQQEDDEMSKETPAFGSTRTTAILPEVERVTGEEGEKHILQIHCKLFMFDSSAHTWRERGRGDLRLNDVPHSEEGVFQSRLVMRAIGSLRVLLNTHLWAQMKCERASPKNVRITAQDEGRIGVFLIAGSQKDANQLFMAIDRRLLALQRTATKVSQEDNQPSTDDRGDGPVQEERDSDEEERSPSTSPDWRARSPYHPSSSPSSPSTNNTTTQQPMESVPSSSPSL